MRGKAQRELARHYIDCKLVPLHNTCQSLPAVCYITSMYTVSQKNDTVLACYNVDVHQPILLFLALLLLRKETVKRYFIFTSHN